MTYILQHRKIFAAVAVVIFWGFISLCWICPMAIAILFLAALGAMTCVGLYRIFMDLIEVVCTK